MAIKLVHHCTCDECCGAGKVVYFQVLHRDDIVFFPATVNDIALGTVLLVIFLTMMYCAGTYSILLIFLVPLCS